MNRVSFFKAIGGAIAAMLGIKYVPKAAALPLPKIPVGMIARCTSAPVGGGWALCNGAPFPKKGFEELADALGGVYGESKDGKTFNIPDWRMSNYCGKDGTAETTGSLEHWIKVK